MAALKLPALQDMARIIRPTVHETSKELVVYYEGRPPFSYDFVRRMAKSLFSGEVSLGQVQKSCELRVHPAGRKQNSEVSELVWQAAQGRSFMCHDLSPRKFYIQKEQAIFVRPLFYFVENGVVKILWLQPRRRYGLSVNQLGILGSVIRHTFLVDDWAEATVQILDCSCPEGGSARALQMYEIEDLPILPDDKLLAAFEILLTAYNELVQSGYQRPVRRPKEKPDSQHDFFRL